MLIPALLMGNTVLFKPPKHGTLLHYPLLDAFAGAFPQGVVNTVYGQEYVIASGHGQQVSIFISDSQEVADLVDQLVNQVSRVNLNAQVQHGPDTFPFTGRKDSAEGTLSVNDARRSCRIRTDVATKTTKANKHPMSALKHPIVS